ncbi:hypothetical protein F511_09287 [Dorcoceras hygrometricum]|uniref:Uncharacterized protein n=1 Tax=Dorcoceras hygrometricum TaxID=472368 RepID=A0A2Z7C8S6_9LAMI|nr:hypothetical protein F511_09287 [Dorcoceras hygrometricum]
MPETTPDGGGRRQHLRAAHGRTLPQFARPTAQACCASPSQLASDSGAYSSNRSATHCATVRKSIANLSAAMLRNQCADQHQEISSLRNLCARPAADSRPAHVRPSREAEQEIWLPCVAGAHVIARACARGGHRHARRRRGRFSKSFASLILKIEIRYNKAAIVLIRSEPWL